MIRVQNVSKVYTLGKVKVEALRDVSFDVEAGAMVCITGRSGSGKSTLLRQLSLIDRPTTGRVVMDDHDVVSLSESKRSKLRLARLGYVFQEYALIPELTAEENVFLPAMMCGRKSKDYRSRARTLLELVGLGSRFSHRPKELSGGEQQRVAIARALVNEPAVIYADEPTANLDSLSGRGVMQTLKRLNNDLGVTILFVSHDPEDGQYASRTIQLRDGALVTGPEAGV
jgi:putative ABC transport system ATP-binding protein